MSIAAGVDAFLAPPANRSRVAVEPAPRVQHDLAAGTEVPLIAPGSDEWYTTISASKIAAITGRSAWDSPYRLFRVMKGHIEPEGMDDVKAAGHYHEAGIAAWFRDQHPDWVVRPCGTFVAASNERHTAAPDRIVIKAGIDGADLLEIKTSRKPEDWGQPGTDEIPPSYRDQVDWQMHCAGASRTHVAVELPWFEFAEYVVDYDPARIAALIAQADAFLTRLDSGECPPPDDHPKTLEAQADYYAAIEADGVVDIDEPLVRHYCEAVAARKAAEKDETGATTAIVEALAGKKSARYDGAIFAEWKPWREGSKPKLYAKGKLPVFEAALPPAVVEFFDAQRTKRETSDAESRAGWITGRLKAIKDADDPKGLEAVRRYWPDGVPVKAPWTEAQIDTIDALLAQVETLDAVPFPATDPTQPDAVEASAAVFAEKRDAIDAKVAADPTLRPVSDDKVKATRFADDLKATVAAMTKDQKSTIVAWQADAKRGGRPWSFSKTSTRRVAAINAAAFAIVLHMLDDLGDDDTAARRGIELAIGLDLQPAWSTGAVLGSLTIDEAQRLTSIANRFAAGDDELCSDIAARLATHYAALDAAS